MRILFAGSPAIAVPSVEDLSVMEMEGKDIVLVGVLTNPDTKKGRSKQEEPTDISAAVSKLNEIRIKNGQLPIPQLKPEKLDANARKEVAALNPDLLVSFGCGHFFGPLFLALFPMGGINIHPSLLPKYRGASPIPAAILACEKETGICIQKIAPELDTGDLLLTNVIKLTGNETTLSLSETVSFMAASLLRDLLLDFESKTASALPQKGEATYCHELKKGDGLIDWKKSAVELDAQIRAFTPWPLSYTFFEKKALYILEAHPLEFSQELISSSPKEQHTQGKVLGKDKSHGVLIQTGDGIFAVTRLQLEARKTLDWKSFCNGTRDFIGARL